MEQTKVALTALEQAVLKLETAIYETKKNQAQLTEQVADLKQAIRTTHDRLNQTIEAYRKGTE
jgi:ABC-type transporter Mla subunit MlaD